MGCAANGLTPVQGSNWGNGLTGTWAYIAGDPLLIAVSNNGTFATWLCQPSPKNIQYQYYGKTSWGTNVWLKGTDTTKHYSTTYYGSSNGGFTPVSHTSSTVGSETTVTTVMNLSTNAQLKQVVTYTAGSYAFKRHWELTNTSASTTWTDIRFFHGGDTFFGGDDSARSWWNPSQNMVYVNNSAFLTSGTMGFYGAPATPAAHYFGGSYSTGYSQASSTAVLSDTTDSNYVDAGFQLEWTKATLAVGETWIFEAYEVYTDPTYLTVLAPADQLAQQNSTVTMNFDVHNLDSSAHTVTVSASTAGGWTTSIVGATSISIPALTRTTVPVQVVVPSDAVIDSIHKVTLTATDGTSSGSSGSNIQVYQPNYTVSPLSIDFGTVATNATGTQTITLSNSGSSVQVGAIGNTNAVAAPFSILNDNCSNHTVAMSATCTFDVRFSPSTATTSSDSFNIPILAPQVTSLTVSLTGMGLLACSADANCAAGNYCDYSTMRCAAKLAAGYNIPNDGLHTGSCTDASTVCQSGSCNSTAHTCGSSNSSTCADDTQCVSNTCRGLHCVAATGGCYDDSDCSAGGQYCNRSTLTCVNKLSSGTSIPNDTLHTGTCSDAAAVCTSGACNTTTSTCAAANGASCSNANQCQTNTCTSGYCIPASNGCAVDANCAAGKFCDHNTFTCATKLTSGTSIPADGLHNHQCSDAAAVCTSGQCNLTQVTCGDSNGTSCSDSNQCTNNNCLHNYCVPTTSGCYLDSDCNFSQYCNRSTFTCTTKLAAGMPIPASDGLHSGTCSAATAVCQSGSCNATAVTCGTANNTACTADAQCVDNTCRGMHCVSALDGCWNDTDCAAGKYCNRSTLSCVDKQAAGTPIQSDSLHTASCDSAAAVCASGLCNAAQVTCGQGNSATCTSNEQCVNNTCLHGFCLPASGGCYEDADCSTNQYCDRSTLSCTAKRGPGLTIPSDGLHGGTCSDAAAVCQTGLCNTNTLRCAASDGNACTNANQCLSATCTSGYCVPDTNGCYVDTDCGAGKYCDRSTLICQTQLTQGMHIPAADTYHTGTCSDAAAVCSDGLCNTSTVTCGASVTTTCTSAAECANNVCATNGKCGVSDGGEGCNSGNVATLCQSGTCASNHCVPSGGTGCYVDADCPQAGYFCDRSSLHCAVKLVNGEPIPSDGLHDGQCTPSAADAVCRTGGCNAVTNTCAAGTDSLCTSPSECVRNICGGNGRCGHENGVGPCTQTNAKFVCQSATCSATANVCVAPTTQTCRADRDCAADQYCDGLNSACVSDLANGRQIPSDVLHDGLCTQVTAIVVCASHVCNASTQTCAAPLGAACTTAAECAGNLCGSNGKCGGAPGQGPCNTANQALCQSGACSVNGTCLAMGKCAVDGDCGAGNYCAGTTKTCVAQLPAGTMLPSDGDHDGTCPGSGLSAACTTGLCSTTTNRCVSPNGAPCTDAQQCAAGVCGSNHACGIEDGGGPCTPGADTHCQSGSCAGDETCDSAQSCTMDSDCTTGGFCRDGNCRPKLGAGSPIPNDSEHMGMCNSSNASAVCASNLCNQTTNTCASARTSACAIGSQCVSNVCGVNGQCGLPNGSGPCTGGDANVVCQSGVCSSVSSACIPYAGCASDDDCVQGEWCDGHTFTCMQRLQGGAAIPNDGIHDGNCSSQTALLCMSGACNPVTDTCAAPNGESCAGPAECASNVCADDGKCGRADGTGPCVSAHADVCRSETCSRTVHVCIPNGGCGSDNDCDGADYCDGTTHQCATRKANGEAVPAGVNGGNCPASGLTRSCSSGTCDTTSNLCVALNGASCNDNTQCQSGVCGSNSKCGIEDGGSCTAGQDARCQSGSCSSDQGTCNAAATCAADADCAPAGYCDGSVCHPVGTPGSPLPNDSLHNGTCSDALAQAVCSTGLCNETTNTCAAPFNTPCATGAYCAGNTCSADGKCGLAVGEGTCNNLNAALRCRTQLCSGAGVCLPDRESGCAVDADCNDGLYCKRDTYECVARLSEGMHIPNDGLHDGSCSPEVAAQVCVSAACNTVTDTCARPNGTGCSSASGCVNNVCGSNGQCGIAEGDGTCTAETASLCQTGRCSASTGKCINTGSGCAADVDCDNTHYCAPDTRTCVSRLGAGSKLPSDSLHDGKCSQALASSLCQTGACNPQTDTCALTNGTHCTAANQCVSNACGENGECGRAVGESGCKKSSEALDCQSGFCAASGVCAPPAGCNVDGDCGSDAYCNRTSHTCATKLAPGAPLPNDGLHDGTCSDALAQALCQSGKCNPVTNTCALSAPGSCTQAEQCTTGVCADNGKCGLADGDGPCSQNLECQSGLCQAEVNKCVAAASGCSDDSDCPAAQHCDRPHVMCVDDLADGAMIPADTMSNGKCTTEVAKIVCQSGACNPDNDTCAKLGGADCDSDAQCAAGSCIEGKCGSPDGSGACSADNATIACQSGECQTDLGRCVAVTGGCRADSDCGSGKYCDAMKLSCAPKLSNGMKLPADTMHSAQCTVDTASSVCESNTCNAVTDRCALAEGEVCVSAAECGSNACLKNVCVPTAKAPGYTSIGGGAGCSVTQVGQDGDRLWSLCLLAAVGGMLRLSRRRSRERHKR